MINRVIQFTNTNIILNRLSDMFIGRFLAINFVGMDVIAGEEIGEFSHFEYDEVDDCLYYIRVLSNVLRYASSLMWETFAEANIAKCANGAAVLEVGKFTDSHPQSGLN